MANEDWDMQMKLEEAKAAAAVERLVNAGGEKHRNALVIDLCSMHRTLQQRLIGDLVVPIVRMFAERNENEYDARNAIACRVCKAMMKGLEAEFPYVASGECRLPLV